LFSANQWPRVNGMGWKFCVAEMFVKSFNVFGNIHALIVKHHRNDIIRAMGFI